jgi:hypothetical protein
MDDMTTVDARPFFHGTKAGLRVGDVLTAGFGSGAGDIIN